MNLIIILKINIIGLKHLELNIIYIKQLIRKNNYILIKINWKLKKYIKRFLIFFIYF